MDVDFCKSIIHSVAGLTYNEAQVMLDDPNIQDVKAESVRRLNELAKIFRNRRMDAGALTLASPEVRFHESAFCGRYHHHRRRCSSRPFSVLPCRVCSNIQLWFQFFDKIRIAHGIAKSQASILMRDITLLVLPVFQGAVRAGQREPKSHGRTDVRSEGNERFSGRVHASGEHHSRQKDPTVGANDATLQLIFSRG